MRFLRHLNSVISFGHLWKTVKFFFVFSFHKGQSIMLWKWKLHCRRDSSTFSVIICTLNSKDVFARNHFRNFPWIRNKTRDGLLPDQGGDQGDGDAERREDIRGGDDAQGGDQLDGDDGAALRLPALQFSFHPHCLASSRKHSSKSGLVCFAWTSPGL